MRYITKNKDGTYHVQHEVNGQQSGFGTFHTLKNAQAWRDEMIEHNWSKDYFHNNIFKTTEYKDRYIKKIGNEYKVVRQFNNGRTRVYGTFKNIEKARERRNQAHHNNWELEYKDEFIEEKNKHYEIIRYVHKDNTVVKYCYGVFDDINVARERRDYLALHNFPKEQIKYSSASMRFIQTTKNKKGVKRYNIRKYVNGKRVTFASDGDKEYAKVLRDIIEFHGWELLQPNIYLYDGKYYLISVTKRHTNKVLKVYKFKDEALDGLLVELERLDAVDFDFYVDTSFKSCDVYFDYGL